MQKTVLHVLILFSLSVSMYAQNQGFNYKALINDGGNAVQNQMIDVQFTLLENGSASVYQESHNPTTDNNGIIIVNIGEGSVVSGDFNFINWENDLFLKVEIDTGSGYQDFGTTSFQYVPYSKWADSSHHANWADEAGNVPENTSDLTNDSGFITSEVDGDTTNELQTISKSGSTVTLSNGGGNFTDADTQLSELDVDGYVSNNGYLTSFTEVDGDTTNELQTISKTGSTVTLSNGGGSFTDTDTDTQLTETQVDNFVANNGYLTSFTEVDGSTTNELQTLSITGDQLTLTDGNTVTLPSSGGADVDFLEVGTGSAPDNIMDNIYHTGNISVGHSDAPSAKIDIDNGGSATNAGSNVGLEINNNNSSNTDKVGVNMFLETASNSADIYASKKVVYAIGDGNIYGDYTAIGMLNGHGEHYGTYHYMDGEGNGKHTGTKSYMFGNAQGEQIGFEADIYMASLANTANLIGVKTNVRGLATGDKYGMVNLLDGDADGNLFGVENTISNTSDYPHYGTINRMEGSGNGQHFATSNIITGDGAGKQYGVRNYNANTGNETHYGVYSKLNGAGSGQHIGVTNLLQGDGTGEQVAVLNEVNNTGDAIHYGVKSILSGDGTGTHYGNHTELSGSGTGNQYAAFYDLNNTGSGLHAGVQANLSGSGVGSQLGFKTEISNSGNSFHYGVSATLTGTGSGSHTGIYSRLSSTGSGTQYGTRNIVNNTGAGTHYGNYIELYGGAGAKYGTRTSINSTSSTTTNYGNYTVVSGSGTGDRYGAKTIISNSNDAQHYGNYVQLNGNGSGRHYGNYVQLNGNGTNKQYGFYSDVSGSGTETKIGVYAVVDPAANGNHYAVYGRALRGTDNTYAGYFYGDAKVTGKLKSEDSGTADMKAYIYGNINGSSSTPSIISNGSSDGFTMTRLDYGQYKITMTNSALGSNNYIVIATVNELSNVWVSSKTHNSFVVRMQQGSVNRDYDFQFVVYKR